MGRPEVVNNLRIKLLETIDKAESCLKIIKKYPNTVNRCNQDRLSVAVEYLDPKMLEEFLRESLVLEDMTRERLLELTDTPNKWRKSNEVLIDAIYEAVFRKPGYERKYIRADNEG